MNKLWVALAAACFAVVLAMPVHAETKSRGINAGNGVEQPTDISSRRHWRRVYWGPRYRHWGPRRVWWGPRYRYWGPRRVWWGPRYYWRPRPVYWAPRYYWRPRPVFWGPRVYWGPRRVWW